MSFQLDYVMMKGSSRHPGDLLCKAITDYDIDIAVIGQHTSGGLGTFMASSTAT
jgi:hypothetical protein